MAPASGFQGLDIYLFLTAQNAYGGKQAEGKLWKLSPGKVINLDHFE